MPAIRINDRLSIVTGDPQGMTITCLHANEAGVMDVFNVSLFFSSAKAMLESLKRGEPWESADKSLAVSGGGDKVTLTFALMGPPFGEVAVTLDGEDSVRFLDEMSKIAEGK